MDDIATPAIAGKEPISEATWTWRCRAPNERTTCLVCDEPLGPHAFRYCSAEDGRLAHKKAERLYGEAYSDPCGDTTVLRRRRKRRSARRASR